MSTHIAKGYHGWKAETHVPLADGYALHFCTMKRSNGAVATTATRVKTEHGGFSFVMFQDFSMKVQTDDKVARATEKSVLEQHKRALAKLAEVKLACEAHYGTPPVDPVAAQFRL